MLDYNDGTLKLAEIAARKKSNEQDIENALAKIAEAATDLGSMTGAYSADIASINANAAANPSDDLYQLQAAAATQLVADFGVAKTKAQMRKAVNVAIQTALNEGEVSGDIEDVIQAVLTALVGGASVSAIETALGAL